LSRVEALGPDVHWFRRRSADIDAGSVAPSSHTAAEHIAGNLTAAGNPAALSDFTGKLTDKANT
jgi:hypothetical protein